MSRPTHKLLYLAPFCHLPPTDGASQRGINLLAQLARHFTLQLLTYRKHDAVALERWAGERAIGLSWLPDPPPAPHNSLWRRLRAARPPGFSSHDPRAIAQAVEQAWVAHGPFDLLFCATQLLGQAALGRNWPAKRVLDLYDIYTPIAHAKAAAVAPLQPYGWLFRLEARRTRAYERRVLGAFDLLLTLSEQDAATARLLAPGARAACVPHGVHLPALRPAPPAGQIVLMVASYNYAPNAEGLRWFYDEVWPLVRQGAPEARLELVGQGGEQLHTLTTGDARVAWLGRVPDLASHYQRATCAIVPLQRGGGVSHKLLEAMAWGVPVVATSTGARGVAHAHTVARADTPTAFAAAVLERLRAPARFGAQATLARQIIAQHYTWERVGEQLLDELGELKRGSPS